MIATVIVVLLCGIGTFLLRFLPLWRIRNRPGRARTAPPPVQRFLRAIGPAAISALLVVSLWPLMAAQASACERLAVMAGLLAIAAVRRLSGGIAAPTLAGAAAYGLMIHLCSL